MTHIANLLGILARGGVCCDRQVRDGKLAAMDIGNAEIKADRFRVPVSCGAGGVVADYVPFYFAPRSPMLFMISKGGVPTYAHGQSDVLYLVSSAQGIKDADLPFVFTNGHARMAISQQFDDLAKLSEVDWPLMGARYWNDNRKTQIESGGGKQSFLSTVFVLLTKSSLLRQGTKRSRTMLKPSSNHLALC